VIIDNLTCPHGECGGTLFIEKEDGVIFAECHLCGRSWTPDQLKEILKKKQEATMAAYDETLPRVKELFNQGNSLSEIERQLNIPKNGIWGRINSWRARELITADELKPGNSGNGVRKVSAPVKRNPEKVKRTEANTEPPPAPSTWADYLKSLSHHELLVYVCGYRQAVSDMAGGRR